MVQALEEIIAKSSSIVFFGGAGVSTESGIPDFRSVDGLYHQKYAYPPETILSHTFWEENPEEFYRFYRDKLIVKGAKPNAAHLRLAKLEREGRLKAVVTQNIDGLHQAAGSRTVGRGGMCSRRADPAVSASGVCFAGYPSAGQSGTVFPAAGRVPCAECAAGMAPAGRPGAHCHPAGSRLCRAGKPRKPAGHRAGTVSRMM